jgi:hypothetical protein
LLDNTRRPKGLKQYWTNPQLKLFNSPFKLTVWWGANGIGKSFGVAELARRAICGELPWQRPGRKYSVLLCGKTWMQLGSTLEYFMKDVPNEWFREGIRFEGGTIKGQRLMVFDVVGGPGAGGKLTVAVFNAENLAGPRYDVVITDEPLPEKVYNELWPRLLGRNGRIYMTFTPTAGTAERLDWLWGIVDDDTKDWAGEIQVELDIDAVTPRGGLFEIPWISKEQIKVFEAGCSAASRDIRMGRSRKPLNEKAVYDAWGDHLFLEREPSWLAKALTRSLKEQQEDPVMVGVGIDHGSKPGAERMILAYVLGRGNRAKVWIPDEYASDGKSTTLDDARGLIDLLNRNDLVLEDVDVWIGDRAHDGGKKGSRKSNERLIAAVAEVLGRPITSLPRSFQKIRVPYKSDRSIDDGIDLIHRHMLLGPEYYAVSRNCHQLDSDHRDWKGGQKEPAKDGCDAERYILSFLMQGAFVGKHS